MQIFVKRSSKKMQDTPQENTYPVKDSSRREEKQKNVICGVHKFHSGNQMCTITNSPIYTFDTTVTSNVIWFKIPFYMLKNTILAMNFSYHNIPVKIMIENNVEFGSAKGLNISVKFSIRPNELPPSSFSCIWLKSKEEFEKRTFEEDPAQIGTKIFVARPTHTKSGLISEENSELQTIEYVVKHNMELKSSLFFGFHIYM